MFIHPYSNKFKTDIFLCVCDDENNQNEGCNGIYNRNDLIIGKEHLFPPLFCKLPPNQDHTFQPDENKIQKYALLPCSNVNGNQQRVMTCNECKQNSISHSNQ